jgi:hypothetical protein
MPPAAAALSPAPWRWGPVALSLQKQTRRLCSQIWYEVGGRDSATGPHLAEVEREQGLALHRERHHRLAEEHKPHLAAGQRVITCPPPSARAQRYIRSQLWLSACRWGWALDGSTARGSPHPRRGRERPQRHGGRHCRRRRPGRHRARGPARRRGGRGGELAGARGAEGVEGQQGDLTPDRFSAGPCRVSKVRKVPLRCAEEYSGDSMRCGERAAADRALQRPKADDPLPAQPGGEGAPAARWPRVGMCGRCEVPGGVQLFT